MQGVKRRIEHLADEVHNMIDPSVFGALEVEHYSIPALDATGLPEVQPADEIQSQKQLLRGGEVLVSRLNPRKARVLTVPPLGECPALCSSEFVVLRPSRVDPRFLEYLLLSEVTRQHLDGAVQSVTRSHQRIRPEHLLKMQVTVPDGPSQRSIANFLDTETARIEALITKKRRIMAILRQRLMVRANELTRSGPRILARHLLDGVKTGTTPGSDDSDLTHDSGDVEWVSPGDVGVGLTLLPAARSVDALAAARGIVPLFPAGSVVVVGIGATAGRVAYVDRPVSGNQQMTCLVPNKLMDGRFLGWQLLARTNEVRAMAPYTTLPILNNDYLRSLILFVPPIEEQKKRSAVLDAELDLSCCGERALSKQMGLLHEHRQALITAAVTGELDIPGVAT